MVPSSGVKKLNLLDLPLTGRVLIEASAGTGKTYSLAFIYLRLLLGIGQNSYPQPLDVSQILVVTFTKAATQELRSRIRKNIHELLIGLQKGQHDDPIYQQLITLIDDRNVAIQKLNQARQSMDEAAIYTIHSFCQRMLTTHAFESGVLFEQTLVVNESQRYLQVVQDFWRNHFTPLNKPQAYLVLQYWQDPASLLADIAPYLNLELTASIDNHFDLVTTITDFYQLNFKRISAIKKAWLDSAHQLADIITSSEVSKQSYSSRNLPNWLTNVSKWASTSTLHFELPAELEKFSQTILNAKTKEGKKAPEHTIFVMIDELYITPIDLRSQILMPIIRLIQQAMYHEKLKQGEMGFEDLLLQLNRALKSQRGDRLAKSIAEKYRIAMIDEFQDTDPIQYQIFDRIYGNDEHNHDTGLLFIGDPKQAIYSFRGADIFTYLTAKLSTGHNHFTMDINWRSSQSMINAVNQLFSIHEKPFVFSDIPFLQMNAASKNSQKALMLNNQTLAALNAYLLPDEVSTVAQYQEQMANCCAKQIVNWLYEPFLLVNNQQERRVVAADIAILVRTGREAELIQRKLALSGVKSVYLSNHNSVFSSTEAKDVLCLLKAALMPENETVLRLALMTSLLGQTMTQLEQITDNQDKWESVVEEFKQYQAIWQYYGVLVMLRRMMKKRHLAENILAHQDGERILTNLMHLSEILQEAANELDSPHALIRWLTKQIVNPDLNLDNHEQRLESDENLVKIITIHKSKGLEFPLVWLPFVAQYRTADSHFYHDENNNYQQTYAWLLTDEIKQQIEKERLAEDLRLLYVAMTRAIYHCSIGLALLKKNHSAINYLLNDALKSINQFANLVEVTLPISAAYYDPAIVTNPSLSANIFQRKLANSWRVTSYTELQKHEQVTTVTTANTEIINEWDEYQASDPVNEINELQYDIHHFPKGTHVGTLLHKMMEKLTSDNVTELSDKLIDKLNLPPNWGAVLVNWVTQLLTSKLNQHGLLFSQVLQGKCINELQFYLPIRRAITSDRLDKLCKEYDVLSKRCPKLDFDTVQGMLKGFIDLVFEWQGKFYIVDYKSNWLGNSADYYDQESLHKAMCEHRYELQYQLYSLALCRFLKSRLPNYQYQTHFGGVYYLFLRGMPDQGVFYHLPDEHFIEKLDQLFDGENSDPCKKSEQYSPL